MIELEDVRIARLAQRTYAVPSTLIARAVELLDSDPNPSMIRALCEVGAITPEQEADLRARREAMRPAGLKLVSVLGKGASATVIKAKDMNGNFFAVKVMRGATKRDYQRREQEVRALDRFDHEGIPRLIQVGEIDGLPFYVMDLVEGETLSSLARRRGKLPWPVVVEVGLAVARALAHVHEKGMVHRDVKPSNVLVTEGGARLVDFGLACKPGQECQGFAVGTPGYISPEAARGEGATRASDIYSFGAMLYYALTAHYPFDGDGAREMVRLAADPALFVDPLLKHRDDLPTRLIALVERCMEKDVARRFESFDEIVATLERVRVRVASCARRIAASSSKVAVATAPKGTRRLVRRRRRRFAAA
ncbi:MAG TPA: serine/threonine-protein kinase [Planctomycetota bacterium]|nr:serine/threonine-protein kinase [Planctomycetota bacterium]